MHLKFAHHFAHFRSTVHESVGSARPGSCCCAAGWLAVSLWLLIASRAGNKTRDRSGCRARSGGALLAPTALSAERSRWGPPCQLTKQKPRSLSDANSVEIVTQLRTFGSKLGFDCDRTALPRPTHHLAAVLDNTKKTAQSERIQ